MDRAGVMPHIKVRKTWEDCSDFEFDSDQQYDLLVLVFDCVIYSKF